MQPAANVVVAGRFRLNRPLARGGMGSVWHATHLGLDIPCAVKFIEGEAAQLAEAHARFEREAKAAAQLRSPHVVQILDHGVWEETPYIAMELLEGEDLGHRLARVGRLAPQELLRVVVHVSRALGKAHSAGIVHRDLKPENIFLVRDDDRELAKVLDFGIAKASSFRVEGGHTKTGTILGTPYYMSPEQAQGTRAVDHRSDLWSLAVIVFRALVGRLPFESEALGDLLMQIMVAPVPLPSQIVPDLAPAFDRWWVRASQRDPAQRHSSAKELVDDLAAAFGYSDAVDSMLAGAHPARWSDVVPPPPGGRAATPAGTPAQGAPTPGTPAQVAPAQATPANTPRTPHGSTKGEMSRTFGGAASAAKTRTAVLVALGVMVPVGVVSLWGASVALRGPAERTSQRTKAAGAASAAAAPPSPQAAESPALPAVPRGEPATAATAAGATSAREAPSAAPVSAGDRGAPSDANANPNGAATPSSNANTTRSAGTAGAPTQPAATGLAHAHERGAAPTPTPAQAATARARPATGPTPAPAPAPAKGNIDLGF